MVKPPLKNRDTRRSDDDYDDRDDDDDDAIRFRDRGRQNPRLRGSHNQPHSPSSESSRRSLNDRAKHLVVSFSAIPNQLNAARRRLVEAEPQLRMDDEYNEMRNSERSNSRSSSEVQSDLESANNDNINNRESRLLNAFDTGIEDSIESGSFIRRTAMRHEQQQQHQLIESISQRQQKQKQQEEERDDHNTLHPLEEEQVVGRKVTFRSDLSIRSPCKKGTSRQSQMQKRDHLIALTSKPRINHNETIREVETTTLIATCETEVVLAWNQLLWNIRSNATHSVIDLCYVQSLLPRDWIKKLCKSLSKSTIVKVVLLAGNLLDENATEKLAQLPPTLCRIDLQHNQLGRSSITNLLFQHGLTLTHLNLSFNAIGDRGCEAIARAFMNVQCALRWLNIAHNDISSYGLCIIAESLAYNRSLIHLDASQNPHIGAQGSIQLFNVLRRDNGPPIRVLDLHKCGIYGDQPSIALARALECGKLWSVDMAYNDLSIRGLCDVARAIGSMPNVTIQWLDLRGCKQLSESNTTIELLKAAVDNCKHVIQLALPDPSNPPATTIRVLRKLRRLSKTNAKRRPIHDDSSSSDRVDNLPSSHHIVENVVDFTPTPSPKYVYDDDDDEKLESTNDQRIEDDECIARQSSADQQGRHDLLITRARIPSSRRRRSIHRTNARDSRTNDDANGLKRLSNRRLRQSVGKERLLNGETLKIHSRVTSKQPIPPSTTQLAQWISHRNSLKNNNDAHEADSLLEDRRSQKSPQQSRERPERPVKNRELSSSSSNERPTMDRNRPSQTKNPLLSSNHQNAAIRKEKYRKSEAPIESHDNGRKIQMTNENVKEIARIGPRPPPGPPPQRAPIIDATDVSQLYASSTTHSETQSDIDSIEDIERSMSRKHVDGIARRNSSRNWMNERKRISSDEKVNDRSEHIQEDMPRRFAAAQSRNDNQPHGRNNRGMSSQNRASVDVKHTAVHQRLDPLPTNQVKNCMAPRRTNVVEKRHSVQAKQSIASKDNMEGYSQTQKNLLNIDGAQNVQSDNRLSSKSVRESARVSDGKLRKGDQSWIRKQRSDGSQDSVTKPSKTAFTDKFKDARDVSPPRATTASTPRRWMISSNPRKTADRPKDADAQSIANKHALSNQRNTPRPPENDCEQSNAPKAARDPSDRRASPITSPGNDYSTIDSLR